MDTVPPIFWPSFQEPDWDLAAGFGLDLPLFERMPERQPRATEPCLIYFLKKELEDRGQADSVFLTVEPETVTLERVDEQGNAVPIVRGDGQGEVNVSPPPQWIVPRGGRVRAVRVGRPRYSEAPGPHRRMLEDFESGSWRVSRDPGIPFASNHWDVVREAVAMTAATVCSEERTSHVLRVTWPRPYPTNAPCVGFYAVLEPDRPLVIPGKARALGKEWEGASQRLRVVYELADAKGESWLSCGAKDAWNADDIHSRSSWNHDG